MRRFRLFLATIVVSLLALCVRLGAAADVTVRRKPVWVGADVSRVTDYMALLERHMLSLERGAKLPSTKGTVRVDFGAPAPGVAYHAFGTFENSINTTGWSFLHMQSNTSIHDAAQAYAAGFAEGAATAELMVSGLINNWGPDYCSGATLKNCQVLQNYYMTNNRFLLSMIQQHHDSSAYWTQVWLAHLQLSGLVDGQNSAAEDGGFRALTDFEVFMLNAGDDAVDIFKAQSAAIPATEQLGDDHCSALIRYVDGEIFVSQVTWTGYAQMLRIWKDYEFGFAHRAKFSSQPGQISSGDDYYELSSGLVTLETTNDIYNYTLYKEFLDPASTVLEYTRTVVANRMANDGVEWTKIYMQYNSGTYNNQWMIVDLNKVSHDGSLLENALVVSEQIPGTIVYGDQTEVLRKQGYWASYNVPFYESIYTISGWPAMFAKYGAPFSHAECPRARIFAQRALNATTIDGMKWLMRYNQFQTDPLAKCPCLPNPPGASPGSAISARHDLASATGSYPYGYGGRVAAGAIDSKITSLSLFRAKTRWLISGPTYQDQPVFVWSTSNFPGVLHLDQPDRWDFPWINYPDPDQ